MDVNGTKRRGKERKEEEGETEIRKRKKRGKICTEKTELL